MRLFGGLLRLEQVVDLDEFLLALAQQLLLRILAANLDELEVVLQTLSHIRTSLQQPQAVAPAAAKLIRVTAGSRASRGTGGLARPYCGLARVLDSSDLRLAALGLTSQKRRT